MAQKDERVEAFHRLHEAGCFVMPNPWDMGSAVALEQMGFKAVATTSAGHAWTLGRPDIGSAAAFAQTGSKAVATTSAGDALTPRRLDKGLRRDEALEHLRQIAGAVSVPVNADFENCFADDPDAVATNVKLAVATGVAGLSIEDSTGDDDDPLYPFELAVERVRAARQAIDESGTGVFLTGRSEGFVVGRPDLEETIRRLQAYADAGADCLYAPWISTVDAGVGDRHRGRTEAREPACQRALHHGRGGRLARRPPDQRRRHARAHRVGRFPRSRRGDRDRGHLHAVGGFAERRRHLRQLTIRPRVRT